MKIGKKIKALRKERKMTLKELSKKNLSKEMFGVGVFMGIQSFIDYMKEMEKNNK